MLADLEEIFRKSARDGVVVMRYRTVAYYGSLT